ncbi:DoxX family protein [Leucobacter massiliensis]|uniref:DoxX family membrane protein n=1 Tax=Leucobacter massiliensis TaxID=1686285 RepID=A0A2S9QS53_9MICO|nr:DoxX family protein [Leucobacter massiliensis]PRI12420.1 hypothetical protein B4915_01765 [Leucobacter massiliensis]
MRERGRRGRLVAKGLLGAGLVFAGTAHLTWARTEFRAQVPDFVPLDPDTTVVASGIAEVALGTALAVAQGRRARRIGVLAAAFFVAVFPGNLAQYVHRRDGFGLDTDRKRLVRLFFQPVLVAAALCSTRR